MPVGTKIKNLRKKRGITQRELADGIVTRGMLSRIENGTATPSVQTLDGLARRLDVSPGFLLESGNDLLPAERARITKLIVNYYTSGDYRACLNIFENSGVEVDVSLAGIFISCSYFVGTDCFYNGDFIAARELFNAIKNRFTLLLLPISGISLKNIDFIMSVMDNIASLETVIDNANDKLDFAFEISLFFSVLKILKSGNGAVVKTLIDLGCFSSKYALFLKAQLQIADYKFIDAIIALKTIIADTDTPCFLSLLSCSVIEYCCKTCEDYKGAYENQAKYRQLLGQIKT